MKPRAGLMLLCHVVAAALFSVAAYAAEAPATPASARLETVAVLADQTPVKAGDKVVATVERGRMFGVIERRGELVEIQVCVGTEIRRGSLRTSDVKSLKDDDIDLAAEWLKMAKDLNPRLDVAACRAKLDALIDRVAAAAAPGNTPREKARLVGGQLFGREGLTYELDAKTPDRLLDLKQGACFGFSFLYLCIGQRLKMPLSLVTAPDHVFVRYEDRGERFNIETTRGGKLHDTDGYLLEYMGDQLLSQIGGPHLASLRVPSALGILFEAWGSALAVMGKAPEACEKYVKAVEISPRLAEAYTGWGNVLGAMGKPAEACEKHAKAVEINPQYAAAYSNWGLALRGMGKAPEACEKCAKAVEINPRLVEAYSNWGAALAGMGKREEACAKYEKAVEINPQYAAAYSNWGNALAAMGKFPEACEKYAKAVEVNPRDAEAYCNWGATLGRMRKYAEGCEKLAKAVEINPQYAAAYLNWGAALAGLGKNAEAIEKAETAAKIDPTLRPRVEKLRAVLER